MQELLRQFSNLDDLYALEVEEMAFVILPLIKSRIQADSLGMVNYGNCLNELTSRSYQSEIVQKIDVAELHLAFAEAWSWLEVQGLLIPALGSNGANGWRILSRRASRISSRIEFNAFVKARRFPKESLHLSIREKVWGAFVRGEFDVAVFNAMKGVEVAVRKATNASNEEVGTKLVRRAFDANSGPLRDPQIEFPERESIAHLFAGAIGVFKNPQSHREVGIADPEQAIEIVMLANLLLRMVDEAKEKITDHENNKTKE
jgi:uncharacterized protein (TIGR02391 family)